MVLPSLVQRLLGVGNGFDHMATFAQAGVEVMAKQGFVLDHQQFHVQLLVCIAYTGLFAAQGCSCRNITPAGAALCCERAGTG